VQGEKFRMNQHRKCAKWSNFIQALERLKT